jgi:hypothetical protein
VDLRDEHGQRGDPNAAQVGRVHLLAQVKRGALHVREVQHAQRTRK